MVLGIGIQEAPNHALVLRIVFLRLALEELDATLAQRNCDFDSLIPKDKILGPGKEIRNDLEVSERFVRVPNFLVHRLAFRCASSQLQKCGVHRRDT